MLSNIHSTYNLVIDLSWLTDIVRSFKADPVTFPLGKNVYDNKIKADGNQISRFAVNVVSRHNVEKTYILCMLANINIDHLFSERTNGLKVSLPLSSQMQDTAMAHIDGAGK
ncbi:unnamed protein product [Rotaria sp. Silwood2]|nr:unnamed protein product [Rotaria sp. Silwood2]CAF2876628.1 unnamed protein product [Rotaria sp. Silwood2]CAF3103326.1 unnamed protein product [Rotaria sp. Silwood2]CAF4006751.1 unnamed protein product [Rotaria sp. Silwood2]CAF4224202.1 unnamed protein product [Rotaria sp. Silwood2]